MEPCVVVFVSVSVSCRRVEQHILKQEADLPGRRGNQLLQIAEGAGVVCVAVFSFGVGVVEVLLDAILTVKHFV